MVGTALYAAASLIEIGTLTIRFDWFPVAMWARI